MRVKYSKFYEKYQVIAKNGCVLEEFKKKKVAQRCARQLEKEERNKNKELCFECGKSVKLGSGKFVNRVPSFNSYTTRKANGAKYPQGEFICEECDTKWRKIDYGNF